MNKKTFSSVLICLKNYKILLALSIIFSIITVFFTLYIPILIGDAVNLICGVNKVDFNAIYSLCIKAAISAALIAISTWIMNVINNKIAYGVVQDLRNKSVKKLQKLPMSYIDSHPHGDTVSRIISDADQFADGLILSFSQLFTGVATIIGTLIFMISINIWIALAVVVLTPMSLLIAKFIASRTYSMFKKQSNIRGKQTAFIEEMITNQKVIKAYSYEDRAKADFATLNEEYRKSSLSAIFFSSLVNPTTRFINNIIYAVVALIGALLAFNGSDILTIGGLTAILTYVNHYTKPFNEISGVIAELQGSFAAVARIFELLDEKEEIPDPATPIELENVQGDFDISNVDFSYDKQKPLIKNLNITAKKGQKIAIVGPTGCGKTTIINLLMRFYETDDGTIKLDNTNVLNLTRENLRSSFGMVLQDTWLSCGTVKENIKIGKPDATDQEIIEAAKAAHAHSFIKRLPNGYDTVLGENGGSLSAGQKQLLCISRIMLNLPPVLILDEATSSIDTMTEMRIQNAFAKLMEGKTSFIVAHRLSTIKSADNILVMKDGNVIEQGTHTELLKRKGFYYELYNSQFAH